MKNLLIFVGLIFVFSFLFVSNVLAEPQWTATFDQSSVRPGALGAITIKITNTDPVNEKDFQFCVGPTSDSTSYLTGSCDSSITYLSAGQSSKTSLKFLVSNDAPTPSSLPILVTINYKYAVFTGWLSASYDKSGYASISGISLKEEANQKIVQLPSYTSSAENAVRDANTATNDAINAINDANSIGADTSTATNYLNNAKSLLISAQSYLSSAQNYQSQAQQYYNANSYSGSISYSDNSISSATSSKNSANNAYNQAIDAKSDAQQAKLEKQQALANQKPQVPTGQLAAQTNQYQSPNQESSSSASSGFVFLILIIIIGVPMFFLMKKINNKKKK